MVFAWSAGADEGSVRAILPLGELFISDAVAAREVPRLYEPLGPQTIDAPPLSAGKTA